MWTSCSMVFRMPGRWTFTATSVPSFKYARWTWARDAAATGLSSNERNTSSGKPPNSAMKIRRTVSYGNGPTSLGNLESSAELSSPTNSARRLRTCPSLTNAGPSRSSTARRTGGDRIGWTPSILIRSGPEGGFLTHRRTRDHRGTRYFSRNRSTSKPPPDSNTTTRILRNRFRSASFMCKDRFATSTSRLVGFSRHPEADTPPPTPHEIHRPEAGFHKVGGHMSSRMGAEHGRDPQRPSQHPPDGMGARPVEICDDQTAAGPEHAVDLA